MPVHQNPIQSGNDLVHRLSFQALALGKLIFQYLPEFEIKKEDLRMFPEDIIADAMQEL